MRIAFPGWRRAHYKIHGSVMAEAIRRKHDVYLLWYKDDSKPGEEVRPDEIPWKWPKIKTAPPSLAYEVDVLCAPLAAWYPAVDEIRHRGVRVVSVDYCLEHISTPPDRRLDLVCYASEWQREHHRLAWAPMALSPAAVTGMPMLDQLALCDEPSMRLRYGFGAKPYVLVFALKFNVPHLWRKLWYKWGQYYVLFAAIRRYCDRVGAKLVVKTRRKNRDPSFLADVADLVVGDDDLYPYTALQLAQGAACAVHWQSGAVFEVAACGIPQVAVAVPHPYLDHFPMHEAMFSTTPPAPNAWPGVVQPFAYRQAAGWFDEQETLPPFRVSEGALESYYRMFLGFQDAQSGARVMDAIEKL